MTQPTSEAQTTSQPLRIAAWKDTGIAGIQVATTLAPHTGPIRHVISIDVEDWVQSVFDKTHAVSERFLPSADRILECLRRRNTKATFFVLGKAAEKAPELVRRFQAEGHDVQSHGYAHIEIHRQTPAEFRQDLLRSKKLLEDIVGTEVFAYRAPDFSILAGNLWALDVLVECGFRCDSSIFPIRMRRYGIHRWPPYIHRLRTPAGNELLEVPVATLRALCLRVPVGGGGYFRLWPYKVIRRTVRQFERAGRPAVIYFHPYEYDPAAFREMAEEVPRWQRVHQGLGREGFPAKIDRLISEFRFGRMCDVLPPG